MECFPLKRRKMQVIVRVVVYEPVYSTIAKITNTVEKNYLFCFNFSICFFVKMWCWSGHLQIPSVGEYLRKALEKC
jgi:hypothetical protein